MFLTFLLFKASPERGGAETNVEAEGYHYEPHPPQGILNGATLQLRRKSRKILPGIP
jgi:hypothetical protein